MAMPTKRINGTWLRKKSGPSWPEGDFIKRGRKARGKGDRATDRLVGVWGGGELKVDGS